MGSFVARPQPDLRGAPRRGRGAGLILCPMTAQGPSLRVRLRRVASLLLSPGAGWAQIADEPTGPLALGLGYVAPLALIPTLAILVSLGLVGVEAGGEVYRVAWTSLAPAAIVFFCLTLAGVFLFAVLVSLIAPLFGGVRDYARAFRLVAYAITPAMLAGLPACLSQLQIFALLGASYSLYLLFTGAPRLLHPSPEAGVNLSLTVTLAALAASVPVGLAVMLTAAPTGRLFPGLPRMSVASVSDMSPSPAPGGGPGLSPGAREAVRLMTGADLRAAAPAELAGTARVAVGYERSGLPGERTVRLEAEYRQGPRRLVLEIIYSPVIARVIGFGGPATSEYDRASADGYTRRLREGGELIVSDWDNASGTGSYGRLLEDCFYVRVRGGGGGLSEEDLKAAALMFGPSHLAQFAAER